MRLRQHHGADGKNLRDGVRFSQPTRTKIARPGRRIEQCGDDDNAQVATENHDRDAARDEADMHQHQKQRAQQQLVRDWVQIGAKLRALPEESGQSAIQAITDAGDDH